MLASNILKIASGRIARPQIASRGCISIRAMAPSDYPRPSGGAQRTPESSPVSGSQPDASSMDPALLSRPSGGSGRMGFPVNDSTAAVNNNNSPSLPDLSRPAGGALRTVSGGGDDDGPGSPTGNGKGGDGDGNSRKGDGMGPILPWVLAYALLCGVAYVGNNLAGNTPVGFPVASATASHAAVSLKSEPAVRPCCAGKASNP